jgi:hypothetical protein
MLPLTPIDNSSMFDAWAYDQATGVLTLRFKKSAFVYHYKGVSPEHATGFAQAESKGSYFCEHIKHEYEAERINTSDGDDTQAEPALQA